MLAVLQLWHCRWSWCCQGSGTATGLTPALAVALARLCRWPVRCRLPSGDWTGRAFGAQLVPPHRPHAISYPARK